MGVTYESLRAMWPRTGGTENLTMGQVVRRVADKMDPLDLNPDYQRGRAWSDDQCARFIGFLAEGGQSPVVFVQRWNTMTGKNDEVLDGLQRLTAILRFMNNEVPMELTDGTRVYLRDFSADDQRMLTGIAGPNVVIQYVLCETRAAVLQMYIRLNRGGTVHTDAEIERVRGLLAAEQE
jgi:hypothetical protein